jgi:long-chain acyl-CoA synthetase
MTATNRSGGPGGHIATPTTARTLIEPTGTLAKLLTGRVSERPEHPFLWVEDEGPWTLADMAAAAAVVAEQLAADGIGRGDRILIPLANDERALPALVGAWLRAASVVAVHPATPANEVARIAETMRAAVFPDLPLYKGGGSAKKAAEVDDGDEALVLLTSGSTGSPKGVALSHGAIWASLKATVSAFRRDSNPTPMPTTQKPPNLIANPLSHTAGVVRLLFALYVGRSVVLLRKFDARAAKAAIDRHGIDNLTINPTMLQMLLDDLPADADLGPVRYASSGTAPLTPALREAFEARFGIPVLQAYGQTEAFGGIAIENVKDVLAGYRRPGSVGKPLPGVEIRIDDGEILARTPTSLTGYLGEDTTSPVDADGWLHTGDLGHLDDDGYLYVTGRRKNVIICGGFNVIPEELEAALGNDDQVREAVVVAVPDERLGEIPVALVEGDGTADAVLQRVTPKLASYKRPRRVFVVDQLPRVANGKVDRVAARTLAEKLRT